MIGACSFREGAALDRTHRVEGVLIAAALSQLIDGDDAGVLEPARDQGFLEEPRTKRWTGNLLGPQFFESHITAQSVVTGQPDLAESTLGVQPQASIALFRRG